MNNVRKPIQVIPYNWLWLDFYDTWANPNGDYADLPINLFLFRGVTLLGERQPAWLRAGVELWSAHPVNDFVISDGNASSREI